jgi:lysozyme
MDAAGEGRFLTRRRKTGFAIAALGVIAMLLAPFLYARLETALLWYDVIGVDVSNHQGDIDWRSLAAGGIAFAYIKATEGGDFRDGRFRKNWDGAKAADMPRGAYHFFTQCRSGAEQAANFIRTVPKEAGVLPPVIDAEHMGPCTSRPPVADIKGEILAFMDLVEAHYGKRPFVYVTREFNQAYLDGHLAAENFWVRSLFLPPAIRRANWLLWQYHHRGRRPGINGPVDLNAFRGSKSEFAALLR